MGRITIGDTEYAEIQKLVNAAALVRDGSVSVREIGAADFVTVRADVFRDLVEAVTTLSPVLHPDSHPF